MTDRVLPDQRRGVARGIALISLGLLLTGLSAGCGLLGGGAKTGGVEVAPAGDEKIELLLQASDKLNVCEDDLPNVLVVRIYQLAGDAAIGLTTQTRLWEDDEAELKESLLERREEILEPGQTLKLEVTSKEGATHLAIAGNFCRAKGDCWRWVGEWKDLEDLQLDAEETCLTARAR